MNTVVKVSIICLTLLSCSGNNDSVRIPAHILPPDTMVSALVDMHIIEGAKTGNKIMGDTLKADMYFAKMYSKYGVSKEEFEENFSYYSQQPVVMDKIYKQVIERLNKIQVEPPRTPLVEEDKDSTVQMPLDSVRFSKKLMNSIIRNKDTAGEE